MDTVLNDGNNMDTIYFASFLFRLFGDVVREDIIGFGEDFIETVLDLIPYESCTLLSAQQPESSTDLTSLRSKDK